MRTVMTAAVVAGMCWMPPQSVTAQTRERLEIGAQFSAMRVSGVDVTDAGVGGRVAWNLSDAIALEAVGDVFPTGRYDVLRGGRKALALAGPKMTWRSDRIGLFAKARTGLARVGEGKLAGGCIAIFPPPEGCYSAENRLAFDLGGGLEVYPSSRTSLRLDIGSILTRLGQSSQRYGNDGDYAHDLQVAAGVGVRF